jgi:hypothetical protein
MIEPEVKVTEQLTQEVTYRFDKESLLRTLRKAGHEIPTDARDVKVFMRVPGGADWSNTNLDVEESCPLIITWKTTKTTELPRKK